MKVEITDIAPQVLTTLVSVDLSLKINLTPEQYNTLDPKVLASAIEDAVEGADGVGDVVYSVDEVKAMPPSIRQAVATLKSWMARNHPGGYLVLEDTYDTGFEIFEVEDEDEPCQCGGC